MRWGSILRGCFGRLTEAEESVHGHRFSANSPRFQGCPALLFGAWYKGYSAVPRRVAYYNGARFYFHSPSPFL